MLVFCFFVCVTGLGLAFKIGDKGKQNSKVAKLFNSIEGCAGFTTKFKHIEVDAKVVVIRVLLMMDLRTEKCAVHSVSYFAKTLSFVC